jgi:hypothetical protein
VEGKKPPELEQNGKSVKRKNKRKAEGKGGRMRGLFLHSFLLPIFQVFCQKKTVAVARFLNMSHAA